jgi:hypothetical protein
VSPEQKKIPGIIKVKTVGMAYNDFANHEGKSQVTGGYKRPKKKKAKAFPHLVIIDRR